MTKTKDAPPIDRPKMKAKIQQLLRQADSLGDTPEAATCGNIAKKLMNDNNFKIGTKSARREARQRPPQNLRLLIDLGRDLFNKLEELDNNGVFTPDDGDEK